MASRYVALLRGINVGGKNKLPMPVLAAMFAELGCKAVRTYIQSGNVVFEASAALARRLPSQVTERIEADLGLKVPVMLRSARELGKIVSEHPLATRGVAEQALHVMFLADRPKAERVAQLDAGRSPGDRFTVVGREIYLCCPNGIGRTKLTNAWFDKTLGTVSTTRNWRSARQLLAMATEGSAPR